MSEGPTVMRTEYRSCWGCKWHEQHMVKSGRSPEYDHRCTHPDNAHDQVAFSFGYRGRPIGRTDHTPGWCPILEPKP